MTTDVKFKVEISSSEINSTPQKFEANIDSDLSPRKGTSPYGEFKCMMDIYSCRFRPYGFMSAFLCDRMTSEYLQVYLADLNKEICKYNIPVKNITYSLILIKGLKLLLMSLAICSGIFSIYNSYLILLIGLSSCLLLTNVF